MDADEDSLAGSSIDLDPPAGSSIGLVSLGGSSIDLVEPVDHAAASRARQWRVRCQDVANRERFVTLFVEHDRVVLVGPPGESAVLTPAQLTQLRTALQEAADEAER